MIITKDFGKVEDKVILLKALYGSDNYNLKTPESDKDYKVFTLPTFDDLYDNKIFLKSIITPEEDMQIADIRKLSLYLFKSNINWIEIMYSKEITCHPDLEELFDMKEDIVAMNIKHLYYACIGDYYSKMGRLHHSTDSSVYLVEKYNYNTKEGLYAYRALDFLQRFHKLGFKDFDKAIRYEGKEIDDMLNIKYGGYKEEDFVKMVEEKLEETKKLEIAYKAFDTDKETLAKVESIIKECVRKNMSI